ncbi:MAG: hypothetical protein DME76_06700 [Verrucomicrobia bacterium]|nr:MAG: hypothetical protein DME76_06700 [Verrucomicrobiota bacterium]
MRFIASEIGAGYGDEAIIRSSVATRAKAVGGDAAIQINDNTTFAGIMRLGPGFYAAANARKMSFANRKIPRLVEGTPRV